MAFFLCILFGPTSWFFVLSAAQRSTAEIKHPLDGKLVKIPEAI